MSDKKNLSVFSYHSSLITHHFLFRWLRGGRRTRLRRRIRVRVVGRSRARRRVGLLLIRRLDALSEFLDFGVGARDRRFEVCAAAFEQFELLLYARALALKALLDRVAHSRRVRSEEHTSELQSRQYLVC